MAKNPLKDGNSLVDFQSSPQSRCMVHICDCSNLPAPTPKDVWRDCRIESLPPKITHTHLETLVWHWIFQGPKWFYYQGRDYDAQPLTAPAVGPKLKRSMVTHGLCLKIRNPKVQWLWLYIYIIYILLYYIYNYIIILYYYIIFTQRKECLHANLYKRSTPLHRCEVMCFQAWKQFLEASAHRWDRQMFAKEVPKVFLNYDG